MSDYVYTGQLQPGQSLVIDGRRWMTMIGRHDKSTQASGLYVELLPGEQDIEVEFDGGIGVELSVRVRWNPRYC